MPVRISLMLILSSLLTNDREAKPIEPCGSLLIPPSSLRILLGNKYPILLIRSAFEIDLPKSENKLLQMQEGTH